MHMRDLIDQRTLVFDRGDAVELRLQRGDAFCVHGFFVHAGTVEITDALIDTVATRSAGRRLLQNVVLDAAIAFANFTETAPSRLVRRNLGALDPVATGVLVEIHARIDAPVDGIETGTISSLRGGISRGRCLREADDAQQK